MKGDQAVRISWDFSVERTHPQARSENEAGADIPQYYYQPIGSKTWEN